MAKKIGLALGSGGARGLVHLGVLQVLVENKLDVDMIAGSSIGAFVGVWYALCRDPYFMVEEIKKKKPKDMAEVMMDFGFGGGLINGRKLEKFIEKMIDKKKFSDLSLPVTVVATDIDRGLPVKFSNGDLAPCIRASMSVPLFFRPAEIDGLKLVDGGLTRPVPVEEVKNMGADVVVAVNLDGGFLSHPATAKKVTLASVSQQSLNIVRHHLSEYETRQADIVLNPDTGITSILGLKNFFDVDTLVALGRDSMNAELDRLKKISV